MRKEKMVTRTVTKTNCEIMCMDIIKAEVVVKDFTIGGKFDSEDELLKTYQKLFDTDTFKLVKVTDFSEEEVLLGMPESKFIELADVLPPRKDYKGGE
jgi:hypothetical protein